MIKKCLLLAGLLISLTATAQTPLWKSEMSWSLPKIVEDMQERVLFSSGDVLAIRNWDYPVEYDFFDRSDGISDIGISQLAYHPEERTALVYYISGKIDLLTPGGFVGISGIYDNFRINDKTLHEIIPWNEYFLLAGNFGLSYLNTQRKTIDATAFSGEAVQGVFVLNERIYAWAGETLKSCSAQSHNPQDPSEWKIEKTLPKGANKLYLFGNRLYILFDQGGISSWEIDHLEGDPRVESTTAERMFLTRYHLVWTEQSTLFVLSSPQELPMEVANERAAVDVSSNTDPNLLWVADGYNFYRFRLDTPNKEKEYFTINTDSPQDNNYFYATAYGGRYYSVSGGRTHDRSRMQGRIKIKDLTQWTNISEEKVTPKTGMPFADIVSIAPDRRNKRNYIAASWGEGLYEFRNDTLYRHYHLENSPLLSAQAGYPDEKNYVRVGSLAQDEKYRWWMAQGSVSTPIWSLNDKGEWTPYAYPEIAQTNAFGKMMPLAGGTKWLLIYHRGDNAPNGVFLFDDKNTPDIADDDRLFVAQFPDRSGKLIAATDYFDMDIDRNGAIWIGTNKGPIYIHNAHRVLKQKGTPTAVRPVGGKEPNLFYVLDNIPITAIAVDPLNHKWMGTSGDGLYLLSEDGTEILGHWTVHNSPLLNNQITSLAIDETTSQLYIGTPNGLMILYMGDGNDFAQLREEAYIYPNPLRPTDPDKVTIGGLAQGCVVRIVDVVGNLLLQETALTSELSFSPRMNNGERYPSGVYQAVIVSPDGSKSYVLRFAVVR